MGKPFCPNFALPKILCYIIELSYTYFVFIILDGKSGALYYKAVMLGMTDWKQGLFVIQ